MKKNILILIAFCSFFLFHTQTVFSQQNREATIPIKGRIIADDSGKPLEYASVTINNTNISTVTNQDGYFSLRIPSSAKNYRLKAQYLGYENINIPVITLIDKDDNVLRMSPGSIRLSEIEVVSGDGTQLVKEALRSVSQNYENNPNMMVAFYRESIKKGSNYISLVEAVLDVYKESYKSFRNDQARIYIGRKATDINVKDTIFLKFQGGISDALMLDIAKHPGVVFGDEIDADYYNFNIDGIITIDDKPHYAISFFPYEGLTEILFRGKIFLDVKSLAFKRMEFNMNVENRKDASSIFIKRKPSSMRISAESAAYVVDYVEKDGKWYYNYSSMEVKFKVRWKRRFFGLFASNYTLFSEMAVTDRYEEPVQKFPRKERIRSSDVIAEKVEHFQDPDFWGDYTVIEPDKEISNAIKRLSDKLKRRD
ncbi:MAG: carboxypeptidase-like regulatory domain-containing protein [Dysgonamonadaceae bacterium]|nr:carboxypeptidase-like regulatory domain-containing protein [Dysgonamonadaceae bacterium]MDD4728740.1 carboxypeptidase-like regulatory domain-containing protein [Dysgonamonadaceae bacterium]